MARDNLYLVVIKEVRYVSLENFFGVGCQAVASRYNSDYLREAKRIPGKIILEMALGGR